MKYLIFGGTGFIGNRLANSLIRNTNEVIVFSRTPGKYEKDFDPAVKLVLADYSSVHTISEYFSGDYSVINLAGESIASGYWTKRRKEKILKSRLNSVKFLGKLLEKSKEKPAVILQASATGYYGSSQNTVFTEDSPSGTGFLADVTRQWEQQLLDCPLPSTRKIFIRTGVVLGSVGGIFPSLYSSVKYYTGAILGSGKQNLPWIHIKDEVQAIRFLLEHKDTEGVYNLSAPEPACMENLIRNLCHLLHRPVWFRIPSALLRIFLGEMADELLLNSQNVYPGALINAGYEFQYPYLQGACSDLVNDFLSK